jgi:hypothetical protein
VRADWWLVETSQQVDRKGTGYYDFLGTKTLRDFQNLVGLDEKLAEKLQKEMRAALARSGVAINNRGIVRFQTITGGYWATLDTINNKAKRNAVRNLDKDLQFDAQEIYSVLPSGLFAFFLANANGDRQDSVPDNIAGDKTNPGNDSRIHFHNCVRCHAPGIQPIDDFVRRVYRAPLSLAVADKDQFRRLQRLYFSDLERQVKKDQDEYAEVLFKLVGLKPAEMARTFGKLHADYEQADLFLPDVSRDTGYSEGQVKKVLLNVATLTPPLSGDFAGLIANKAEPVRRQMLEDNFTELMTNLRGYLPSNARVKPR